MPPARVERRQAVDGRGEHFGRTARSIGFVGGDENVRPPRIGGTREPQLRRSAAGKRTIHEIGRIIESIDAIQ